MAATETIAVMLLSAAQWVHPEYLSKARPF